MLRQARRRAFVSASVRWEGGGGICCSDADIINSTRVGLADITLACLSGSYSGLAASTCVACPSFSSSVGGANTCTCNGGYSTTGSGNTLSCTGAQRAAAWESERARRGGTNKLIFFVRPGPVLCAQRVISTRLRRSACSAAKPVQATPPLLV